MTTVWLDCRGVGGAVRVPSTLGPGRQVGARLSPAASAAATSLTGSRSSSPTPRASRKLNSPTTRLRPTPCSAARISAVWYALACRRGAQGVQGGGRRERVCCGAQTQGVCAGVTCHACSSQLHARFKHPDARGWLAGWHSRSRRQHPALPRAQPLTVMDGQYQAAPSRPSARSAGQERCSTWRLPSALSPDVVLVLKAGLVNT